MTSRAALRIGAPSSLKRALLHPSIREMSRAQERVKADRARRRSALPSMTRVIRRIVVARGGEVACTQASRNSRVRPTDVQLRLNGAYSGARLSTHRFINGHIAQMAVRLRASV